MSAKIKLFTGEAVDTMGEVGGAASIGPSTTGNDEQALLDELRAQYEKLRDEVAAVVSHRTQQARDLAQDGADGLRSSIRAAPGSSIALAAVAGGLIAVLLTSRRPEPTWSDTFQSSAGKFAHRAQAALRTADIEALADQLRQSADNSFASARGQMSGIVPGLERLAEKLSSMDASALSPAIEKSASWLKSVWDKLPAAPSMK